MALKTGSTRAHMSISRSWKTGICTITSPIRNLATYEESVKDEEGVEGVEGVDGGGGGGG